MLTLWKRLQVQRQKLTREALLPNGGAVEAEERQCATPEEVHAPKGDESLSAPKRSPSHCPMKNSNPPWTAAMLRGFAIGF